MINIRFPIHGTMFWQKQFFPDGIDLFEKSNILDFQFIHNDIRIIDFVDFSPILAASQRGFKVVRHVI